MSNGNEKMNSVLVRIVETGKFTQGRLYLYNGEAEQLFSCCTLELPWLENEKNISCIPAGNYHIRQRYSYRFRDHWHVENVPDRSMILIHSGNYTRDTHGCVLVGRVFTDMDQDGIPDVTHSRSTLNAFIKAVGGKKKIPFSVVRIETAKPDSK